MGTKVSKRWYGVIMLGAWFLFVLAEPLQARSKPVTSSPTVQSKIHLPLVMKPGIKTVTLYPTENTKVIEGRPTYADCTVWREIGAGYDDYTNPPFKTLRGLVKFNLSGIPSSSEILSATLSLKLQGWYDHPNTLRTITTYRAASAWSECSVNWINQPSIAEPYGSQAVPTETGKWYTFDVTALVSGWVRSEFPNYGLWVRGPELSGDPSWRSFAAKTEITPSEDFPYLTVSYSSN